MVSFYYSFLVIFCTLFFCKYTFPGSCYFLYVLYICVLWSIASRKSPFICALNTECKTDMTDISWNVKFFYSQFNNVTFGNLGQHSILHSAANRCRARQKSLSRTGDWSGCSIKNVNGDDANVVIRIHYVSCGVESHSTACRPTASQVTGFDRCRRQRTGSIAWRRCNIWISVIIRRFVQYGH